MNNLLTTISIFALYSLAYKVLNVHSFTFTSTTSSSISFSSSSLQNSPNNENEESKRKKRICIIGGGASGMFAASIAASTIHQHQKKEEECCEIVILEGGKKLMAKVEISGGGRCNVMHDTSLPLTQILTSYPRGQRELHGIYAKHFTPAQMKSWFESRGVPLKTEMDGRMFPTTDNSQTIMNVIYKEATKFDNVEICLGCKVTRVEKLDHDDDTNDAKDGQKRGFLVTTKQQQGEEQHHHFDAIILATGSSPTGYKLASQLGLKMVQPIPSLFTLELKEQVKDENGVLHGLAGLSVPKARVTLKYSVPNRKKKQSIIQEGPLLITHHGLSGPAALRLSAFAAREFNNLNYNCDVNIHWCTAFGSTEEVEDTLWKMKSTTLSPKRFVSSICPLEKGGERSSNDYNNAGKVLGSAGVGIKPSTQQQPLIPKRLWNALCTSAKIQQDTTWGNVSKKQIRSLSNSLTNFMAHVSGKGVFKEEFVTAGGISTKDVDMTTMSCKKKKKKKGGGDGGGGGSGNGDGVFVCGEVVNVDGVTGGFNFMNCWGTGFMAGKGAANFVLNEI